MSNPVRNGHAVRGIEAAAKALALSVECYAVGDGEGARRLAGALEQPTDTRPERLDGRGPDAARAALGAAAAGRRTALIVSGAGVYDALPALRQMCQAAVPVLLVIPSHGDDVGSTHPEPGLDDLIPLLGMHVGVLVASDATQVGDLVLVALRAASDRGAPWAVAFELGHVGLALSNGVLADPDVVHSWTSGLARASDGGERPVAREHDAGSYQRSSERFGFALGAAMRDLERSVRRSYAPVIATGVHDPDVVLIAAGHAARTARHAANMPGRHGHHVSAMQVVSLRPFPAADIVRASWRARAILVHEAHPEPLGIGGTLSDAVRAAFADALTWHPGYTGIGRIPPVVTVVGHDVTAAQWLSAIELVATAADPPRLIVARPRTEASVTPDVTLELAMDEAQRETTLQLVIEWLARAGREIWAHSHEPTHTMLSFDRETGASGPGHVLLALAGGAFDPARLETLPSGSVAVLAGDFSDRVLADSIRVGALRGIRVVGLPGNSSGPSRAPEPTVAAAIAVLGGQETVDSSELRAVAVDRLGRESDSFVSQVRARIEALRPHLG